MDKSGLYLSQVKIYFINSTEHFRKKQILILELMMDDDPAGKT